MINKSRRDEIQTAAALNTRERIQSDLLERQARRDREVEESKKSYLGGLQETKIKFDCKLCKQTTTILLDVNEYAGCDCCGGGDSDINATLVCSNCGETLFDWWSKDV